MVDFDSLVIGPLMGVFGESVTYRPVTGGSISITGVFDDAYTKEVMFEDETTGVTEASAVLGVQLSQFPTPPTQNGRLTVLRTGASYVVREVRTDSHGGARLMLSRTS